MGCRTETGPALPTLDFHDQSGATAFGSILSHKPTKTSGRMKMRVGLAMLLAMAAMPIVSMPTASAQDNAVYAVSYIDVAPSARGTATTLLQQFANGSRKDAGNVRFDILQRMAPSNQFAIVAVWKDQNAYDAHLGAAHTKEFREKIKPLLISAIDDRVHTGMEVAGTPAAKNGRGAVVVVTHVDVPPPKKDECIAALKTLVADSRKEAGSVRFEVFQQGNRPNHFSVVEVWKDQRAYDAHITAAPTKKFRDQLTPMSGALYDERLYKAI
jgi:quinol monooxygenase YgiN